MSNITNFAEKAPNLPFTEYDFYELYRETFEQSELGRIKRLLPLHELATSCGLMGESLRPKRGRRSYFTPEGKVALMFLKMKIQELQEQLAKAWKPWMKDLDTMYTDATCYESEMRYPTDQKLLWEGIEKAYAMISRPRSRSGAARQPRRWSGTSYVQNWPGCAPPRWRARSGRRRSTTISSG